MKYSKILQGLCLELYKRKDGKIITMSNLTVLDVNDFLKAVDAQEVTDDSIVTAKGKYSPGGLFSESIFGLDRSKDRGKKYGFISLNTLILHPFIYDIMKKMEVRVTELIDGDTMYYDEANKLIYKDLKKEYKGNNPDSLKQISGYDGAMYAILKAEPSAMTSLSFVTSLSRSSLPPL